MKFFKPVWMTKDKSEKDEAIYEVRQMADDQGKLLKVAREAYLDEVRYAAICLITDDEALFEIALIEERSKNIEEAIARIKDKAYLEKIISESEDKYLIERCKARLLSWGIDFKNLSTQEAVNLFAGLDVESYEVFAKSKNFDIALDKFTDGDLPSNFAQVPEEIAKKIFASFLAKHCRYHGVNPKVRGFYDNDAIKTFAPYFKEIWDETTYQGLKELIARFIWPYSAQVAEYMLLNNVRLGEDIPLESSNQSTLVKLVDNLDVLRYAAENSYSDYIRECASEKLKGKHIG
ncbi:MAG: hypothetical protein MJ146_02385 [Clostridia bacterium]|nr:hypothetical protein [Clostridia bacterium]